MAFDSPRAYSLRPYQMEAIDDLRSAIAQGAKAPLLVMATGLGKTLVSAAIIKSSVAKGKHVLFLAPRRELVYQTCDKLSAFGVDHGILMAGERPAFSPPVQVACTPTLYRRCFRNGELVTQDGYGGLTLPRADLIVIDEAHANMSSMASSILAAYPRAIRIGMTATPARSDGRGLGELYDAITFGPNVAQATADGFLVPIVYWGASKADLSQVKIQAGDYHQGQLGGAMNQPKLVGDVVQNWMRICPDRKTVVFAVNRAHAMALHREFTDHGFPSGYLDGETPNDERAQILRDIESGAIQVLCSVDVLTFGWDAPPVSCGIIARPTKSIARYLQAAGRILRTYPGKEDAYLIDHAGVIDELGFVDDEQPWSLDGKEKIQDRKEATEKKEPKPIECPRCRAVIKPAAVCPQCGADLRMQRAKAIEAFEAELQEIKRKEQRNATMNDKQEWWSGFLWMAKERGKTEKWCLAQYKQKFGVWPRNLNDTPKPPATHIIDWEHSRRIAYAKSKAR